MKRVVNVQDNNRNGIRAVLKPVFYLVGIVVFNLLSRAIFSPLLPVIERDLRITHAQAGSFFLFISLGYTFSMFISGFVSRSMTHRRTILLSVCGCSFSLFFLYLSPSLTIIKIGLLLLGMSTGLYFPSGMATLTSMVESKHWGKAIALHEFGTNLSLILAPVVAQLSLQFTPWRGVLVILGAGNLIMGTIYGLLGKGGKFPGATPSLSNIRLIFSQSTFWIVMILFCLAAGSTIGVYSILPTYLISARGMEQVEANVLVSLSRIFTLFMVVLAGWFVDHFGIKLVMGFVCVFAGTLTILLGLTHRVGLFLVVFFQPVVLAGFFPAALSALAKIGPPHIRNVTISLIIPLALLFGGGIVPAGMGLLGEHSCFEVGFFILGGTLLISMILLLFLPSMKQGDHYVNKKILK